MALSARTLAQLGFVAHFDAEALHDHYAWPPLPPPSPEVVEEQDRLHAIADRIFERAEALGFEGGTDAAFGPLLREQAPERSVAR